MECVRDYIKSYEMEPNKDSLCNAVKVAADHGEQ